MDPTAPRVARIAARAPDSEWALYKVCARAQRLTLDQFAVRALHTHFPAPIDLTGEADDSGVLPAPPLWHQGTPVAKRPAPTPDADEAANGQRMVAAAGPLQGERVRSRTIFVTREIFSRIQYYRYLSGVPASVFLMTALALEVDRLSRWAPQRHPVDFDLPLGRSPLTAVGAAPATDRNLVAVRIPKAAYEAMHHHRTKAAWIAIAMIAEILPDAPGLSLSASEHLHLASHVDERFLATPPAVEGERLKRYRIELPEALEYRLRACEHAMQLRRGQLLAGLLTHLTWRHAAIFRHADRARAVDGRWRVLSPEALRSAKAQGADAETPRAVAERAGLRAPRSAPAAGDRRAQTPPRKAALPADRRKVEP